MTFIYTVVDNENIYPNAFVTYKEALDAVKEKNVDWNEDEENEIDVEEGHKLNKTAKPNPNITELYIEKGIYIFIHKLLLKKSKPILLKKSKPTRRHSIGGAYPKKNTSRKTEK